MTQLSSSLVALAQSFLSGHSLSSTELSRLSAAGTDFDHWRTCLFPPRSYQDHAVGCSEPVQVPNYPESALYWHVPEAYHHDRPCRLFLFMHGGDTGTPNTAPYDSYIGPNGVMHRFLQDWPGIVAAPSAPLAPKGKRWNHPGVVEYLLAVLQLTMQTFNIDRERIILGGHSMGGFGAYHLGQVLADKTAGLWLSAGAWQRADFRTLLGTPVYISHAKYDCAYAYRGGHKCPRHHNWCGTSFARACHELLLRDHVDHVYDEHDGGHGLSWEPSQMSLRRFLNWSLRQKRDCFPRRVALVTPRGSADPDLVDRRFAHWLSIDEQSPGEITYDRINLTGPNVAWNIDELQAQSYFLTQEKLPGARLCAEHDGKNNFQITAEHVKAFTLWLHPAMLDLQQPVTINCNGEVITEMATPSLLTYLENIRLRQDEAAPFIAKIAVRLK